MAYVQGTKYDNCDPSDGSDLSVSATYALHDRAQVTCTYGSDWGTETISDGTNSYSSVGRIYDNLNNQVLVVYECKDCAAGTFTVNFHLPTSAPFRGILVTHQSGLDNTTAAQIAVSNSVNPGSGTDALTTASLTPASQPGMLLGVSMDDNGGESSITQGTGFSSVGIMATWDSNFNTLSRIEDKRITSTASTAATFTAGTGGGRFINAAIFIPEAAGGGGGGGNTGFYHRSRVTWIGG